MPVSRTLTTGLLATLLLAATPAVASAAPTDADLLALCEKGHADCTYLPGSYRQYLGPRKQVGDTVFNCDGSPVQHSVSWTDTATTSRNFGGGGNVGAAYYVTAAISAQFGVEWSNSKTYSQTDQITVPPSSVGWIERATLVQEVTGTHVVKVHFPHRLKYGKHAVVPNSTYTGPAHGNHALVVNTRPMSAEERVRVCRADDGAQVETDPPISVTRTHTG